MRQKSERSLPGAPGDDVVFSTTHQQALLDYVKSNAVDVVMVDIHMPEINGIDLCHLILEAFGEIWFLTMSSGVSGLRDSG